MIRTGWNNVINVVKHGLILMADLLKNPCCDEPALVNVFDRSRVAITPAIMIAGALAGKPTMQCLNCKDIVTLSEPFILTPVDDNNA